MKHIRNFCIIAHIDHGKSTLADRLLEYTKTISQREAQAQLLDNMDLERERGITIKSHAIQMNYKVDDIEYNFNLIDTPGHVDFSYEVSRSIAACEGALLIVDASQGIQAQTISNLYLALEHDLEIIPILNKMDLPGAMPEEVKDQIIDLIGCKREDIIPASGKTGMGIPDIIQAIVDRVPAPVGDPEAPLQALIFDSVFNPFRGIIAYYKVVNGEIKKGDKVKFINTGKQYLADEVGILKLDMSPRSVVKTGDVGYIISGIKEAREVKVGDTITTVDRPSLDSIQGFEEVKPMVFAGIYPVDTDEFEELREAMHKLQLNDASIVFEPESSAALGFGFRCGFLGMLHMEIIQERLEREFDMTVITTVPNVSYIARTTKGEEVIVNNPSDLPDPSKLDSVEEPYIKANIITKAEFVGPVMSLCIQKRGIIVNQSYLTSDRVELIFEMPMGEIVFDFYDKLKTISKGYASFDYHQVGYRKSDLVRLDMLLNEEPVDALSSLIHRSNAYDFGKKICEKLRELIPRQQFEIKIQASIGAKVIARETLSALRKDVTAKCYGGDISRKRKLLEKQKQGKKRMRQVGNVEIPQTAFMAVLKLD
ncbi:MULTISPECIES: translation elongation factor 4 [Pedobacter]|uniref:Elongation factor 4 n=1 Tax=Pedobacter heparinus (strain ATCC 13125 / DSM 2366 / CIP 104194 / JCM 7457 / NBRC 12017 / NCIMB 9290 / NRRL B-14731 / HIM 762-3) TaxID=485917 RepID=C6XWY1_PEDHD|nr:MULTISPECIES: translation elongation factor 4 [Pedobacter]ACU04275.1 GTP-binding protein LepA [Pedobacter heparinus DSM 2366]MBB5440408.1 GTP-binding protein LepA [Pedobacter sp. AK017]